jgi:hypothetical protein
MWINCDVFNKIKGLLPKFYTYSDEIMRLETIQQYSEYEKIKNF